MLVNCRNITKLTVMQGICNSYCARHNGSTLKHIICLHICGVSVKISFQYSLLPSKIAFHINILVNTITGKDNNILIWHHFVKTLYVYGSIFD